MESDAALCLRTVLEGFGQAELVTSERTERFAGHQLVRATCLARGDRDRALLWVSGAKAQPG